MRGASCCVVRVGLRARLRCCSLSRFVDSRVVGARSLVVVRSRGWAAGLAIAKPTFAYLSAFCANELAHPTILPFSVVCIVYDLFLSFLVLIVFLLFNNLLVWSYVGAGEFQNMWSTAIQEKPLLGGLKCV